MNEISLELVFPKPPYGAVNIFQKKLLDIFVWVQVWAPFGYPMESRKIDPAFRESIFTPKFTIKNDDV